jgi:sucrose-6F-phosphate phosphohydrolase
MDRGRLLVADLDGTLLGDDAALIRFASWLRGRRDLFRLVYASGRHRDSIMNVVASSELPEPDALISAVGTEIHDPAGRPWPGWLERFNGWSGDGVRQALRSFPEVQPQPAAAQTARKASFDVPNLGPTDLDAIRRTLAAARLPSTLVYSCDLYLDVLPDVGGKGHAARFLADAWGVAAKDVLVFGDSGNDLQMFQQGFRGTIVANALPELRLAVGPDVYRSPLSYAGGVLDGVLYWSES